MTYYEVDSTMWDDEDFISYDDATRNLWQLLLTGPQRTAIPGLQRGGMATLAETLRRAPEAVTESFGKIAAKGKAGFDATHRVIWVPNAPKYNQAKSPNQIRAWWARWKEIPDCDAKFRHVAHLREYAHLERPTHLEAWQSTFGTIEKPSGSPPEALPKGSNSVSSSPAEGTLARACADTAHSTQISAAATATEAAEGGELEGAAACRVSGARRESEEFKSIEAELRRWPVFADQDFKKLASSLDGIRIAAAKKPEWVIAAVAAAGGKIGARIAGGEHLGRARIAEVVAGYVTQAAPPRTRGAPLQKVQPSTGQRFQPALVLK